MKKEIRKISRVGKRSYSVVLPAEFMRKLGWRERQKVVLSLRGKAITIRDWKKSEK